MIAAGRIRGRMIWAATLIFAVSSTLVLSFILFEVLDIDGSNFPVPDKGGARTISATESTPDIRWTLVGLHPPPVASAPQEIVIPAPSGHSFERRWLTAVLCPSPLAAQRFHLALPRASLPDPLVG